MKKLLLCLICMFTALAQASTLAYQCTACTANSGVEFTANTAGDMLLAVAVHTNTTTITGITDTAGNTWSATPDCTAAIVGGYDVSFFHTSGIKAATNNTITVTASASVAYFTVLANESTLSALDTCGTVSTGDSATPTSTITPTGAAVRIFAYGGGNANITAGAGATVAAVPSPTTGDVLVYQASTGATSQTVNFTQSSTEWASVAVAYKGSVAPPAGANPFWFAIP